MELAPYLRTILLYLLAGLAEIGGGWLVWQWLREGRSVLVGTLPLCQDRLRQLSTQEKGRIRGREDKEG
jgi:drug/metabolite transporter superfamily protein YnfA